MAYSNIYLQKRSKPSLVLIILSIIALGGFVVAFFKPTAPIIRASRHTLLYHTVVNIAARQAGVYYETEAKTPSWIIYGTSANHLDTTSIDDRDTESEKSSTLLHYIPLKGLKPSTTYYYKIIAENEVISVGSHDTFSFTTSPDYSLANTTPPAYGKVVYTNGQQASNAFVLYYYPGAYPLLTEVKGGDWLITLNSLINQSDNKLITPDINEKVKLVMKDEDNKVTIFETTLANTTPLSKTVTLGSAYAVNDQTVLGVSTDKPSTKTAVPQKIAAKVSPTTVKNSPTPTPHFPISILFPQEDSVIPGGSPLIKGLAVPQKQVAVKLNKNAKMLYSNQISVNEKGEWKLSLPITLTAGDYVLAMNTTDTSGKRVAVQRSFTIGKGGENVLAVATGPGSLTPTVQATPTAVPTVAPTAIPTDTPAPTAPTITVTPPVTGFDASSLMLGGLGLIIIAGGALFVL
jgi:hypothetical protein